MKPRITANTAAPPSASSAVTLPPIVHAIGQNKTTTTLIVGNQLGYSADDEKLLIGSPSVREVSLGSLSLLTSQCISITHHYLDRIFEIE
eukprot:scaffold16580_cov147-Skeletonema_marinoi.AAC.2